MQLQYRCINCGWQGFQEQLTCETVNSCAGDDKLETCPECGSEKVFIVFKN